MYTSLLYIWSTAIYQARRLKLENRTRLILHVRWGSEALMMIIFIVFAVVFYTIDEDSILPCKRQEVLMTYAKHQTVNFAYLIFLGILSLIMAVTVITCAALLLTLIGNSKSSGRMRALAQMVPLSSSS